MTRILTPILLLIVAAIVFFYFTDPVLTDIDGLRAREAELEVALVNADKLLKLQDKLLADYRNISSEDEENLNRMLPDNIDNVRLIIDINNIAKNYGLTVKNPAITGNKEEEEEKTKSVRGGKELEADNSVVISFSVSTTYEILKVFLDDLAHSLRLVDIEDLSVTAGVERSSLGDYKVSLRTYWFK